MSVSPSRIEMRLLTHQYPALGPLAEIATRYQFCGVGATYLHQVYFRRRRRSHCVLQASRPTVVLGSIDTAISTTDAGNVGSFQE